MSTVESDVKKSPRKKYPSNGSGGTVADYMPSPVSIAVRNALWIDLPRVQVDPIVVQLVALRVKELTKDGSQVDRVLAAIEQKWTDAVAALSDQLNKESLDDCLRLLLSNQEIYASILNGLIDADFDLADVSGAKERILRVLPTPNGEKGDLLKKAVTEVLARRDIQMPAALSEYVVRQVWALNPSVGQGVIVPAILKVYDSTVSAGLLPGYVNWWIRRQSIPPDKITDTVRQNMVDYLLGLELPYDSDNFEGDFQAGKYDQFFALAFEDAREKTSGENDPIDAMRTRGAVAAWDFTVDTFDQAEAQGVIPDWIRAAGGLDWCYWMGEALGIYKIVDSVVLRWGSGALDVPPGPTTSKLYRYYKMRDQRASAEERSMVYKRVLNRGEATLTQQMVVNTAFPRLWHKLMAEVAEFIRKSEETKGGPEQVSPTPIYQAVRDLQYNLSDNMTGLAPMQVQEMYAQLQEAIDILSDPQVIDQFGVGRRKNLWTVVERIAKEEFGTALNVASIRTLAVEGNKVFRWIADFDGTNAIRAAIDFSANATDTKTLNALLEPAEAWIIAQADIDGSLDDQPAEDAKRPEEPAVVAPPAKSGGDDFADWNV